MGTHVLWTISVILIILGIHADGTIVTIPTSSSNTFANGYGEIVVRAEIKDQNFLSCLWLYNGKHSRPFYNKLFGCQKIKPIFGTTTCKRELGYIKSNLTFTLPSHSTLNISVQCRVSSSTTNLLLPIKVVQECPKQFPLFLIVEANSYNYEASGTFDCSDNAELFYPNGTPSSSPVQTSCLFSATWSGQKDIQCWTARNVFISGKLIGNSGTHLDLSCDQQNINPIGKYSTFYFRNNSKKILTSKAYSILLRPEYDRSTIYCQANTRYTEFYREKGKSPTYELNVQYEPYRDGGPIKCHWLTNHSGFCNITFKANPTPKFVSLIKDDRFVKNDISSTVKNSAVYPYKQFSFYRAIVSSSDRGTYKLLLNSSVFPAYQTIEFIVTVDGEIDLLKWLIPLVVLFPLLILVIAVVVWCFVRRKRKSLKLNKGTGLPGITYVGSRHSKTKSKSAADGIYPWDITYANKADEMLDDEESWDYFSDPEELEKQADAPEFKEVSEEQQQGSAPEFKEVIEEEEQQQTNDSAERLPSQDSVYPATIPRVQPSRPVADAADQQEAISESREDIDPDAARRSPSMDRSHHSTVPRTQPPRPVTRSPGKYKQRDVGPGSHDNRDGVNQQHPDAARRFPSMNRSHHSTVPRTQSPRPVTRSPDRRDVTSGSHGNRDAVNQQRPDAARRLDSMNRSHHSTVPRTHPVHPVTRSPGKYNQSGSHGNRDAVNQQHPDAARRLDSMNRSHHSTVPRTQPPRPVTRSPDQRNEASGSHGNRDAVNQQHPGAARRLDSMNRSHHSTVPRTQSPHPVTRSPVSDRRDVPSGGHGNRYGANHLYPDQRGLTSGSHGNRDAVNQQRPGAARRLDSMNRSHHSTVPRTQSPRPVTRPPGKYNQRDVGSGSHGNREAVNQHHPDAARRLDSMNRSHHSTVPRTHPVHHVTRSPGKYNRRDGRSGSHDNRSAVNQQNPAHHSTVPRSQPFRHAARSAAEYDYDDYDDHHRRRYLRN